MSALARLYQERHSASSGGGNGAFVGQTTDPTPLSPLVALRQGLSGSRQSGTPNPSPLKPEPNIVTKADLVDYAGILLPIIKGLNGDLTENTIYLNPDAEHVAAEDLFKQAGDLDGCYQGTTCPDMTPGATIPSVTANPKAYQAHQLRLQGLQHIVDARLMENKIKAREDVGQKVSNAQIKAENDLWQEWLLYRRRVEGFLKSLDGALLVKGSDFEQLQQYDLQLQAYRNRYQGLTGRAPSTPLPPSVPAGPPLIPAIPSGILLLAGAAVGLLILRELRPERTVVLSTASQPRALPIQAQAQEPRTLRETERTPPTQSVAGLRAPTHSNTRPSLFERIVAKTTRSPKPIEDPYQTMEPARSSRRDTLRDQPRSGTRTKTRATGT